MKDPVQSNTIIPTVNSMQIKFKKLHPDAVLPAHSKLGDMGADITAVSDGEMVAVDKDGEITYYVEYKTGLACAIPPGYAGLLFPRSSQSNYATSLTNSVGCLDSGYRGEILFRFRIDSGVIAQAEFEKKTARVYKKGDRIGQLVIVPYLTQNPVWVDELDQTDRGEGGFGSTGA